MRTARHRLTAALIIVLGYLFGAAFGTVARAGEDLSPGASHVRGI